MKGRITTLAFLLILAAAGLEAQQRATPCADIVLPDMPAQTDTADNIAIGKYTIWACYPGQACFFLSMRSATITITLNDADEQEFSADITQVTDLVYRAEISPTQWVEVNAGTGETIVHQHCLSRVFRNERDIFYSDSVRDR